MSIDFTEIDKVIETLQKKAIGAPYSSPPVMLKGHLGLWRTIRGFRTFLELIPGDGKYNFDGKSYKGGRVLLGPPSLVNRPIGDVPDEVWSGLSGTGTKETFSSASPEGMGSLRTSIKNSLKDDDTRVEQLGEADLPKLVQIARSAGFTDKEIKEALGGKVFQDAIGDNVVPFKPKAKAPDPEPEPKEVEEVKPKDDKVVPLRPDAPTEPAPTSGKMTADGSLAPLIEALKIPGIHNADKKRAAADKLAEAAKAIKEDILRKQVEALANGLRTNDYKIEDVKNEIRSLIQHRKALLLAAMDEAGMEKLSDKAAAKDAVREIKTHADTHPDPTPEQATKDVAVYVEALEQLATRLQNPEVKAQVQTLIKEVKARKLTGKNLLLRVLSVLRLVLAFIPGLG